MHSKFISDDLLNTEIQKNISKRTSHKYMGWYIRHKVETHYNQTYQNVHIITNIYKQWHSRRTQSSVLLVQFMGAYSYFI